MRNLSLLSILVAVLFLSNCSGTKYVKYDEVKPDLITTNKLKSYLSNTKNPSVVLRVPNSQPTPTTGASSDVFSSIYNTIEKEFLRAGFKVRDRGLFNEIINNFQENASYKKLQSTTNTDIIIELVEIDTKVPFTTNEYYPNKTTQTEKTFDEGQGLTAYGASVEFKIILIQNNQFAGSYVFYYEPCPNGCPIETTQFGPEFSNRKQKEDEDNEEEKKADPFQYISKPVIETFIQDATQSLINEMRGN